MNILNWFKGLFKSSYIGYKTQSPKKYSRVSQEEIDMMRSLYRFDYSIQDIVVISGRCESSVRKYIKGEVDEV